MRSGVAKTVIVLVRGSDGTGMRDLLLPAADLVISELEQPAELIDLDYPAEVRITSLRWLGWVRLGKSPSIGVERLSALLEELAKDGAHVGLMGFSQGALVITETLSEPAVRRHGGQVAGLSADALGCVAAAVSIGNPSFRWVERFNGGTPVEGIDGMFARPAGVLDHVASRLLDLAEHDDISAQHKMSSCMDGHLAYGRRGYARVAANHVLERLSSVTATGGRRGKARPSTGRSPCAGRAFAR